MKNAIRSLSVLAVAACLASAMCLAQSGQATYRSSCQGCHGANGVPSPGMAKMMGIKAVTDPAIKRLTVVEMFTAVKNGKGKMHPFAGKLTDAQIKGAVEYYRSLK